MNPTLKTYPDGSEFKLSHFGAACVIAAISGTIIVVAQERYYKMRYGWKGDKKSKK